MRHISVIVIRLCVLVFPLCPGFKEVLSIQGTSLQSERLTTAYLK